MKVLLDTHALLWALCASPKLSARALAVIKDVDNEILVSVVSALEISIKKSLGKLTAPAGISIAAEEAGFECRGLDLKVAERLSDLPWHHRDPFDRMLIAFAQVEGIPIVSKDEKFALYNVGVIW